MQRALVFSVVVLMAASISYACGGYLQLPVLAKRALSEDPAVSKTAIRLLRIHGPEGLDALLSECGVTAESLAAGQAISPQAKAALDAVGGQRDCAASRLFWYTDFESAKATAAHEQKPILSLRMLGNLTDELSCANSRFFRTTLYSNTAVSKILREKFVLHWQSVRPVPVVTIDFGDGRKLERTVTGNSAHYVLDAQGRPLDSLPGLYGAAAFERWLGEMEQLFRDTQSEDRANVLAEFHRRKARETRDAFRADMKAIGATSAQSLDDTAWGQIARLHIADAQLDEASRRLIAAKNPPAAKAARIAITKSIPESPLVRLVRNLQNAVSLDSVRNEYVLHQQIHEWFGGGLVGDDLAKLNDWVYSELFLTPANDPWLGLNPTDTYTGLERGGLAENRAR